MRIDARSRIAGPSGMALRGCVLCLAGLMAGPGAQAQLTKCQGGGRTAYVQDGRCPPGQQPVPLQLPALSQADRHPVEPRPRFGREAVGREDMRDPRPTAQGGTGAPGAARRDLRRQDCAGWAQQIEAIDARARQPQSAATQDSLRAQRARLRERQAAAGC